MGKVRRRILSERAVSQVIAALLLTTLAISVAALAVVLMQKQWKVGSERFSLDMSESRIVVNSKTGQGSITIVIKNTGTTTAKLEMIKIGENVLQVWFLGTATLIYGDASPISGVMKGSISKVQVTEEGLIIPSGQSATVKFDSVSNLKGYLSVGEQYNGFVVPTTGGQVVTFKILVEPTGA